MNRGFVSMKNLTEDINSQLHVTPFFLVLSVCLSKVRELELYALSFLFFSSSFLLAFSFFI